MICTERSPSLFMHPSRPSGPLNEIDGRYGSRFGNRTSSARLQSTYAVDSCVSQNARSSASVLNAGTRVLGRTAPGPPSGVPRFLEIRAVVINDSRFALQVSLRNNSNPSSIRPQRHDHAQPP